MKKIIKAVLAFIAVAGSINLLVELLARERASPDHSTRTQAVTDTAWVDSFVSRQIEAHADFLTEEHREVLRHGTILALREGCSTEHLRKRGWERTEHPRLLMTHCPVGAVAARDHQVYLDLEDGRVYRSRYGIDGRTPGDSSAGRTGDVEGAIQAPSPPGTGR